MKTKRSWRALAMMLAAILMLTGAPVGPAALHSAALADEEVSEPAPEPKPEPKPEPEKQEEKSESKSESSGDSSKGDSNADGGSDKGGSSTEGNSDSEEKKPSGEETKKPDDKETTTPGDKETTTPDGQETEPPGDKETEEPGDAQTKEPGDGQTTEPDDTQSTEPEESETPDPDATLAPETSESPESSESPEPSESPTPAPKKKSASRYTTWYGVEPTKEEGLPVPIYYQSDYPETIVTIRGIPRSVKSSGCGAACSAMVVAYLTGNMEETPKTMFLRAIDGGRYDGAGLSRETIAWLLDQFGVKTKRIPNKASAIIQALNEGKPIIAHMGRGIFTKGGHYVVLKGIASDGKILLNDPISPTKTHRKFPIQTILTQAGGDRAFQVCWVEPEGSPEPTLDPEETLEPGATMAPDAEGEVVEAPEDAETGSVEEVVEEEEVVESVESESEVVVEEVVAED